MSDIKNDIRFNPNNKSPREIARKRLEGKDPESFLKSQFVKLEDIDSTPKGFTCEKHGYFDAKISRLGERFLVGSMCSKCVDEFDKLVDQEEKQVNSEIEALRIEKKIEETNEYLLRNGFSKRYLDKSLDNFVCDTPEKQNALDKCISLCNDIANDKSGSNLIMVGGVGTGKTHLANGMIKSLYEKDKKGSRVNLIDLIRDLKGTWRKDSEHTEDEIIDFYTNLDLLVIDEIGIQFNSDTEKMFIFDIINGRYENCLPTVLISNLDINGVKDIVGERCVDRLREDGGKVIAFDWKSHR